MLNSFLVLVIQNTGYGVRLPGFKVQLHYLNQRQASHPLHASNFSSEKWEYNNLCLIGYYEESMS